MHQDAFCIDVASLREGIEAAALLLAEQQGRRTKRYIIPERSLIHKQCYQATAAQADIPGTVGRTPLSVLYLRAWLGSGWARVRNPDLTRLPAAMQSLVRHSVPIGHTVR